MDSDEMNEVLRRMYANLKTQDNRCTANPIFVVQQRRRILGLDPNFVDTHVWICDGEEVSPEEAAKIDAEFERTHENPEGCEYTGYVDVWEFVTACFTEQGCKDYLAANGHNLKDPRIYADSGFRNAEWQAVREYFLKGEQK